MIILEHVNKYFNKHKKNQIHVINDTSIKLENTGLVAFLGSSGSGKTTLLNAIGGLDKINKGKIIINGKTITKKSTYKVDKIRNFNIGYIFQDYNLLDQLTVFDNVALALKIVGIKDSNEIKKRVNYVLEKVGMYRYRNRYANMLSGGERQRVGIARAIVKDPNIIIADEPTGNLDSKNSIEIMNIIKAISKDRLIILVTHERTLAEFYASRIIEIEDGKITSDIDNKHTDALDYRMDNKLYLKDYKVHKIIKDSDVCVNIYGNEKDKFNINVVYQNGNIYIQTTSNNKLEVIDENSNIEFIDDHYKKISSSIYEKYDFDFDKVINKSYKKKYTSIFNPISLLINGFRKVRDYSFLKKLLLIGFFASAMFITYSFASVFGIFNVDDNSFVNVNKNYLNVLIQKVKVSDYLEYEQDKNIEYVIPGNSIVNFNINYKDYYQTSTYNDIITGSLTSINTLSENDIVYGVYPSNDNEVVLDIFTLNNYISKGFTLQLGLKYPKDFIGRTISIKYVGDFNIVGLTDLSSPSIYVADNKLINIVANSTLVDDEIEYRTDIMEEETVDYIDYTLVKDLIKLKKGSWPKKDYEVIVNYNYKDEYKLNKTINVKVNGKKLKVVGYYTSKSSMNAYLVSNNTIKYNLIENTPNMVMYSKNKETVINKYQNLNIQDSYTYSKNEYLSNKKQSMNSNLIFSVIILLISLIEIYLMIRSSFLSRIKEIGIYRAIGVKRKDIKKMFIGEIFAITSIASMLGVIFMTYIIKQLLNISYLQSKYMMNYKILILVIIFIYTFNIFVGLIPVRRVLRQTPARILSRNDI